MTTLVVVSSSLSLFAAATIDWGKDLDFVVSSLEEIHPNPYHRIEKGEFLAAAKELKDDLADLWDQQAALRLAELVALLEDGHTRLDLAPVISEEISYPVRMELFPDGIGVVAASRDHEELLGRRIIELGGRPIDDIWERMQSVAKGDNVHSKIANTPSLMSSPGALQAIGVGDGATVEVVVETSGERRSTTLAATSRKDEHSTGMHALQESFADDAAMSYRHSSLPYWTELEKDSGLLYVRINQILNANEPVLLNGRKEVAALADLYQHVFSLWDSGEVTRLVIDLRDNGGGNNALARPFVDGVVARDSLNQKGRLFVLTDGTTYSAAMNLVSMLEGRTETIFVGEAPGGSPLHYGDARAVRLPSSGLTLRISLLRWDLGVSPWDVRDEMEPDLPAPMTLEALIEGRDPALETVLEYDEGAILSDELLTVFQRDGFDAALGRANAAIEASDTVWSPAMEQLLDFGWKLIGARASEEQIYGAFQFVAEHYDDHFLPWYTLGRVYLWPGEVSRAEVAFGKAAALRTSNGTIRRMAALTARLVDEKQPSGVELAGSELDEFLSCHVRPMRSRTIDFESGDVLGTTTVVDVTHSFSQHD